MTWGRSRRGLLILAATVGASLAMPLRPAGAAVEGECTATFNGIAVERIDSLGSPLELTVDDELRFGGVDDSGTRRASVELILGSLRLDREVTRYAEVRTDFTVGLQLGDVSRIAVGLFRVRGTSDGCTADAWVRISGRMPLATAVGIVGVVVGLGGLIGQAAAVASRRRRSWVPAAIAGVATGFGGALLAQQFGVLQLSYPSLGLSVAAAMAIGALAARGTARRRRPDPAAAPSVERGGTAAAQAEPAASRRGATPAGAAPPAAIGPYWCYVMSPLEVRDLREPTRVIAVLHPGTWYLARRESGEWVHVVADEDLEGWAPRSAVHRHG